MDFDATHYAKYRLQSGDILVSEGQSPELVGQSAIYRGEIDGLCFQKTLHRFRPVPGGPGAEFAQMVCRAHVRSGVFMRLASITTNIAHLTLEKFREAPFPLPPLGEQIRISQECDRLLTLADDVQRLASETKHRYDSLRQAILLSGPSRASWSIRTRTTSRPPSCWSASALNARRAPAATARCVLPRSDRRNRRPLRNVARAPGSAVVPRHRHVLVL
jgi:hypothetical protein